MKLGRGSSAEAEAWFRATAEREPETESPGKFMMAEFLERHGRAEEAEAWYRRAALATDGGHDVLRAAERLADLLSARKAYAEAETWYCRAYYGDDPPGSPERRPLRERSRPIDGAGRQPGVAYKRAANLLALGRVADADAFLLEDEEYQRRNPSRGLPEVVTTAVLTGVLVPFFQAMVSKAGEDGYQAARASIRRWAKTLRRSPALPPEDASREAGTDGVVLRISADVTDEALRRLAALDFAVIRQTMGSAVEVSWDDSSHEWKITSRG
ncbi:tetratricopeptide repeat protein [Streptomyces eurythermus]|uniref:tetratricopeptide repeat protein n=1 Tax=Streptomyces eurythermus TaxID=42237 RepID=UPI0036FA4E71